LDNDPSERLFSGKVISERCARLGGGKAMKIQKALCNLIAASVALAAMLLWAKPSFAESDYPATDHAWSGTDYQDFNTAVDAKKVPLPLLSDPVGRPVFERIVSLENLDVGRDNSLPLLTRLQRVVALTEGVRKVLVAYITEANNGKPRERELARLQVYMLAQAAIELRLAQEFIPTLAKDNTYETRMAGFAKMKGGMRTEVSGIIQSTGETTFYSKESLLGIIEGLTTYLPGLQPALTDESRAESAHQVEHELDATTDPDIKSALQRLQAALGKS
jgi:hypothetical protein